MYLFLNLKANEAFGGVLGSRGLYAKLLKFLPRKDFDEPLNLAEFEVFASLI